MTRSNKALTATARRISCRYGGIYQADDGFFVAENSLIIAVETSATLAEGLARLHAAAGARYIAVTNKEALTEALKVTQGTLIGVMDPQGNIVQPATNAQNGDGSAS